MGKIGDKYRILWYGKEYMNKASECYKSLSWLTDTGKNKQKADLNLNIQNKYWHLGCSRKIDIANEFKCILQTVRKHFKELLPFDPSNQVLSRSPNEIKILFHLIHQRFFYALQCFYKALSCYRMDKEVESICIYTRILVSWERRKYLHLQGYGWTLITLWKVK